MIKPRVCCMSCGCVSVCCTLPWLLLVSRPAILRYLASKYTHFLGFGLTVATRMMVESLLSWANAQLHRYLIHLD